MPEPDWDRWHELRDIRDGPGLNKAERAEYVSYLPIVAKLDAEEAAVGKAAIDKLMKRHGERFAELSAECRRLGE